MTININCSPRIARAELSRLCSLHSTRKVYQLDNYSPRSTVRQSDRLKRRYSLGKYLRLIHASVKTLIMTWQSSPIHQLQFQLFPSRLFPRSSTSTRPGIGGSSIGGVWSHRAIFHP